VLKRVDPPTRSAFLRALLKSPTNDEYAVADKIGHFYGIDLMRGIAAITVLIWHYQHFYMTEGVKFVDGAPAIDRTIQPLYWLLYPIYENGFWAVNAFWVISGFVFAHVYAGRETTAASFAGARFARLYPLHLITLITIAVIQEISFGLVHRYQIVGANDPISFVLQLLFVSGWGFEHGGNFNGPIWSVSVEIAIYAGFFFVARRVLSLGLLIPAVIAGICGILINNESPVWNFPLCGFFFFMGVSLYYWLLKFHRNVWMIAIPSVVSAAIFLYLVGSGQAAHMRFYDVQCFLFAPIVLLIGWLELFGPFRRLILPVKWIGDATYSTYLWHFPIQVLILTIFAYFGLSHSVFNNPATLIVWVIGMVLLAHLSFVKIERPLQAFVKAKFREVTSGEPRPDAARSKLSVKL
jgi:peptidoglycan/LPS O-acetylase OafA/YrhL